MIVAFFDKCNSSIKKDALGKKYLEIYIAMSNNSRISFEKKIAKIISNKHELVIWGIGSLTSRLLANTSLGRDPIVAFVDSNKSLLGKKLFGVPIESPEYFSHNIIQTVFIGSFIYKDEIRKRLREKYNFDGTIITI